VNSDSEGYHETITRVFLTGVRLFLSEADSSEPLHELVNELLLSPMGRRDWPLRFYSRDRLLSVEARRNFIPPDLAALPPGCAFAPRCADVVDHCREVTPPETTLVDGHRVRCWLRDPRTDTVGGSIQRGAA